MQRFYWIIALVAALSLLAACGEKEPAEQQPVVEEPSTEQPVSEQPEATAEAAEPEEETQEIVEESASEAEPEDEDINLAMAEPAQAAPVQAPPEWQFSEGRHYDRLVPTQPTVGGADKIEVSEFFWYGCPHCKDFEPFINKWGTEKPVNTRFVKIPIVWNQLAALHGQMYYTAEILARNGHLDDIDAFHRFAFDSYRRLTSVGAIETALSRFGVTAEQFKSTWESFEVNQQLRIANDLMRRYKIDGVPAVVVNGKYRTGATKTGSYPKLLELIDELIVRESLR